MNKQISLVVLVIGIVLVIYGVNAAHSFSSDVSRTFTGSPSDRAMWLLGAGAVLSIFGGYGLTRQAE